jgi:hypothetical protein
MEVRGSTFFYFTDNIVTYYAVSKGASRIPYLHAIVEACKALEAELGCQLEPIHVPGTTIIIQTTDGLSRGIWGSPLHDRVSQKAILSEIFAPVPMCPTLGDRACRQADINPSIVWYHRRWEEPWTFGSVVNRFTVWAPPPELAGQLIHFLLNVYVEAPLTTAALLLIPRVLQCHWQGMSRTVVQEVGVYQRSVIPVICHTNLTIPIVLLNIPFHIRRVPTVRRLDSPASSPSQRIHELTKTSLRGMLEDLDSR